MKLNTIIIENNEKQYNRMRDQLSKIHSLNIVSHYLGEQPFESAITSINKHKPHLLIIDWDLDDDQERKGEQILKNIDPYPFYVFFCSAYIQAVNKTQPIFQNSKFFLKEPAIKFFPEEELDAAIKIAQEYLQDEMTITLKYYRDGKSGHGRDNILERRFHCKNIISLSASGKQYNFVCQINNEIKEFSGPCEKSSDVQKFVNSANYLALIEASENPYTVFNKSFYDHIPNSHTYKLKSDYKTSWNKEIKVNYS